MESNYTIAELRGIEQQHMCKKCAGGGYVVYPSTAMWRGGIGGMVITPGVCDKCWGSGDVSHTWADLRAVDARIETLERALKEIHDRPDVPFSIVQIVRRALLIPDEEEKDERPSKS